MIIEGLKGKSLYICFCVWRDLQQFCIDCCGGLARTWVLKEAKYRYLLSIFVSIEVYRQLFYYYMCGILRLIGFLVFSFLAEFR